MLSIMWISSYLIRQISLASFKAESRFVVLIVPPLSGQYGATVVREIFEISWQHNIVNIIVLVSPSDEQQQLDDETLPVFTFYPFMPHKCEHMTPILLAHYTRRAGFPPGTRLFPDKYSNMYGCPLHIATYEFAPYVMMQHSRNRSKSTNHTDHILAMDGIDGLAIRTFAERLNFSTHIINCVFRGIVHGPGNGTGCFGMVMRGEANLTIGNLGNTFTRNAHMRATTPMYFTSVMLGLPHGRPYTSLQKLLQPFRPHLWTFLAATGCGAAAVLLLIDVVAPSGWRTLLIGPDRRPLSTALAVALGYGVTRVPERNFARFMFISWTVLMFVVRNSYQGYLCYFLQRHRVIPRPTTVDELMAANYTIYVEPSSKMFLEMIPQFKHASYADYFGQLNSMPHLATTTEDAAYVMSVIVVQYFNHMEIRRGRSVDVSSERLLLVPASIFTPKDSSLKPTFNYLIERITSAGLLEKWMNWLAPKMPASVAAEMERVGPSKLLMEQMRGTFVICALMLAGSCVVFALELIVYRVQMKRKIK